MGAVLSAPLKRAHLLSRSRGNCRPTDALKLYSAKGRNLLDWASNMGQVCARGAVLHVHKLPTKRFLPMATCLL
eukprot:CAMPEP_0115258354 /NCGR_PEP_ID=MMETSP0270-20121206/47246_1 /TAXON_ID=71861 /ORGANISM="Scrippsiella trochoidea, Strain CCMP3099" /LENGTH=73 /DNA_ID=CAMNT_0002674091 /DNA_START=144 /DNA_END=365 /DNA_ORIENTATION=-